MFQDKIRVSFDQTDFYGAPFSLLLELDVQNSLLNQYILRFKTYEEFIKFIHSFRKQLTDVENNLLGELKNGTI